MIIDDFDFQINEKSIAYHPVENRSDSRLMQMRADGSLQHRKFFDVIELLQAGDCLVLNDTKVMPARLLAQKSTGGKIEILVEQVISPQQALCRVGSNKQAKAGWEFVLQHAAGKLLEKQTDSWLVELEEGDWHSLMAKEGHMPLPPYIKREDNPKDADRYQTVYAQYSGSIAAPTAGLHFNKELLELIEKKGVKIASITLHVGFGTFAPVRVKNILQHKMHAEYFTVSESAATTINQCQEAGGRIIAVGTTSLRTLEAMAQSGEICASQGSTDIFIYPGYNFKVVNALITNFHLPKSTLLMLVSAFAGRENILSAYEIAQREGYRFYSYGDAMFLERATL